MKTVSACLRFLNKLRHNEQGSVVVTWGFGMLGVIILAGSAVDLSLSTKAKKLARIAADNMALTASVAVDHEDPDRFVEFTPYTYAEIGGPSEDFTGTMLGSVEYDIQDGDEKLIARATVTGSYDTVFMSLIGVDAVPIRAISDVSYAEKKGSPASVFFVADNSGSMGYTDGSGVSKIESLETSLQSFMGTLYTLDNDGIDDTFRTALYPYSADPNGNYGFIDGDGLIPSTVKAPSWGRIATDDIVAMDDYYGTDSSGALQDAADAFEFEDAIHLNINGDENPLKYVVFMTDGSNNQSTETTTQSVWVLNGDAEYWWKYRNDGSIRKRYREPRNTGSWTYVAETYDGTGYYEDQEVETTDYHFDVRSLQACDQMKAAGVLIYTIAYDVADDEKAHAETFLQSCSSGDDFYKSADDSSALAEAFDAIGESILTDVIRIKR